MALFQSPNVVTDGLVLCLDAANIKSYSGSGTNWKNLTGTSIDGTLTNGPTFSGDNLGYLLFDGTNDYTSFSSYSQPAYSTSTSFTWYVWVYPFAVGQNDELILGNRGNDLDFTKLTTNRFEYYSDNFGPAMTANIWQNICITKNGTSFTYYKNGISVATQTSSITKPSKDFFIGGDPRPEAGSAELSHSRISIVAIYDKALTAAEVLQNYNALKNRYGL
jgi:hypothetical protein|tara:strand:- start:55 stop:714 length:660 start_codon:yes stop_codon:yes gene_type:complete